MNGMEVPNVPIVQVVPPFLKARRLECPFSYLAFQPFLPYQRFERLEPLERLEQSERSEDGMLDGVVRFLPSSRPGIAPKDIGKIVPCGMFLRRLRQIRGSRRDHRSRAVRYLRPTQRTLERLALNLLDEGLKPLDRVVMQLPNVVEFATLFRCKGSAAS